MRELYHAVSSGDRAMFHFYKALKELEPALFEDLEDKDKKNVKKREESVTCDGPPSAKRPRTQEAAATAAGAEQNQGREARNKTEPGSRLEFRTLSEMEKHVEDLTVREELIKELKMKLEDISPSAAAKFMRKFRPEIIQHVSQPVTFADYLLRDEIITNEYYARIRKAGTPQEQMRELYDAVPNVDHAMLAFYETLKEHNLFLFSDLKDKDKKNVKKREGSVTCDGPLSAKRPRTQEAAATAAGAEQNQGREARNKTEPGSRLEFRTLSEMEKHVEDLTVREELIKELKMKLEGGEQRSQNRQEVTSMGVSQPNSCLFLCSQSAVGHLLVMLTDRSS
ncbi:hypothetical protein MATL_G00200290 [Megalops atlanticus]|uniref:CARD domain-containing protein n=1 Tax=Megalops atlanticus TaxID=7932 RepID=A0A9D3PLC6_MEGAT|nr:hypothetical protein MATL_G00200290 [Megalops atlanticus]